MIGHEEKYICCCRVSSCTKFVALSQIVFGAVAGTFLAFSLSALLNVRHLPLLVATMVVQLACHVAWVFMGIILLISTFKRSTSYLNAWTILVVIFFILDIICTILAHVAEEIMTLGDSSPGRIMILIIKLLFMAALFRFGIYVIQTFESNIQAKECDDDDENQDI